MGPNTHVSASFSKAIDANSLAGDSLEVLCNGQAIAGTVSASGSTVFFSPSGALADGNSCTGTFKSGSALDGSPLAGELTFTVDPAPSYQWHFTEPKLAYQSPAGLVHAHDVGYWDGVLLIALSRGSEIYLAASSDGGATFSVVQAERVGSGTVADADVTYANGRAHIAWRFLPFNTANSEIYYAHSASTLDTLSTPQVVSFEYDDMAAMDPRVATGSDATVQVTWMERCGDGCYPSLIGVHMASFINNGNLMTSKTQITNEIAEDPIALWLNGSLLMTWISHEEVSPYDYSNVLRNHTANSLIGERSVSKEQIDPTRAFLKTGASTAVLHWKERQEENNAAYYVVRYDAATGALSEPQQISYVPRDAYRFHVTRMDASTDGTLAWVTALAPKSTGFIVPVQRTLRRSTDGGVSFTSATELPFMLPYAPLEQSSDEIIPRVAAAEGGEVFVIWTRKSGDTWALQSSKGALAPSCSK